MRFPLLLVLLSAAAVHMKNWNQIVTILSPSPPQAKVCEKNKLKRASLGALGMVTTCLPKARNGDHMYGSSSN